MTARADHTTTHRSFISYIDRTREYYAAQGYERPYAWARHEGAPFAPLTKPLAECRLGVITTASPWQGQQVVSGVLRGEKQVYAAPAAPPPQRMFTDDLSWDKETTHTDDTASFLPLAALAEAAKKGRIAAASPRYYGVPTDYSRRRTLQQDAPRLLEYCREDALDAVLLVPI